MIPERNHEVSMGVALAEAKAALPPRKPKTLVDFIKSASPSEPDKLESAVSTRRDEPGLASIHRAITFDVSIPFAEWPGSMTTDEIKDAVSDHAEGIARDAIDALPQAWSIETISVTGEDEAPTLNIDAKAQAFVIQFDLEIRAWLEASPTE